LPPAGEIVYSLLWRLPALILVLLLLEKKPSLRPKTGVLTLAVTLPALCIAGFLVSALSALTGFFPPQAVPAPAGAAGWAAAVLLSLCTGCLEEAYFRAYLPERIRLAMHGARAMKQSAERNAFLISALVFALCHAYEGPWGFLNALLAALVLSVAYSKSESLPGIALAHGLYNILVYLSTMIGKA